MIYLSYADNYNKGSRNKQIWSDFFQGSDYFNKIVKLISTKILDLFRT